MFQDRADAGKQLAQALTAYRGEGALVLAIPRGGVEIGYQIATALDADFNLIITRKLPFPYNPEAGFGALAEDGSTWIYERAARGITPEMRARIMARQQEEITRRIEVLRQGRALPSLAGRTVILVDDGIAMGSTMRASIMMCRQQEAGKIIVAVPVAGPRTYREMQALVDEVVALEVPADFHAVAQVYANWYDVSDREVLEIMDRWRREEER